jgi:hypothetical protein
MAYQVCATNVISSLKEIYPNKDWKEINKPEKYDIILAKILHYLGSKALLLDDEICIKLYNHVYKGLTNSNYLVPLMDVDIDPALRQFNEYDKDYDECLIEEENNNFKFNLT